MKSFLEYLLLQMVDDKEGVVVDEMVDEFGQTILTISVSQADMGKTIGKGGKVIRAIRELVKVLAVKENKKVQVQLSERKD